MADTLTTLQLLNILSTGTMANTSVLSSQEASFHSNNGYTAINQKINTDMNALEARLGTVATFQTVARQGLGLEITATQATQAAADLKSLGADTWSEIFHWLVDNQTSLTTTLDNRADAAMHFTAQAAAKGTSGVFSGASMDAAVGNVLQGIGASAQSLDQGKQTLTALAGKIGPNGISGTIAGAYLAGAEVRADPNGNWWWSDDEWATVVGDNAAFTIPANAVAGRLIAHGGVDMLTGKPFTGVLTAPAGSTILNPLTSMVQGQIEAGLSLQQAVANVKSVFGLATDVNIMTYEPRKVLADMHAGAAAHATALKTEKVMLQIANVTIQVGAAIDAAGNNLSSADRSLDVNKALAAIVNEFARAGQPLDLTESNIIARVIANSDINGTVTSSTARLTTIVDASNTAIFVAANGIALAKAATVTQGEIIAGLYNAIDNNTLDAAVSAYTGFNLDARIAAAQPREIFPGMEISLVGSASVG